VCFLQDGHAAHTPGWRCTAVHYSSGELPVLQQQQPTPVCACMGDACCSCPPAPGTGVHCRRGAQQQQTHVRRRSSERAPLACGRAQGCSQNYNDTESQFCVLVLFQGRLKAPAAPARAPHNPTRCNVLWGRGLSWVRGNALDGRVMMMTRVEKLSPASLPLLEQQQFLSCVQRRAASNLQTVCRRGLMRGPVLRVCTHMLQSPNSCCTTLPHTHAHAHAHAHIPLRRSRLAGCR
jgi:hypothetical protein